MLKTDFIPSGCDIFCFISNIDTVLNNVLCHFSLTVLYYEIFSLIRVSILVWFVSQSSSTYYLWLLFHNALQGDSIPLDSPQGDECIAL